eukprot:14258993-Alexandrium_andersonii.AAC.1
MVRITGNRGAGCEDPPPRRARKAQCLHCPTVPVLRTFNAKGDLLTERTVFAPPNGLVLHRN